MKKDKLTLSTAEYFALKLQIRAEQLTQDRRSFTPTPTRERTQRKHFFPSEKSVNNEITGVIHRQRKHYDGVKLTQSPDLAHRQRRHYDAPKNNITLKHPSEKERVRFYRKNLES